jgi:hypothetical protein
MSNDRFKAKIKKLEEEREAFLKKLTPEDQQQYQQIQDAYNRQRGSSQDPPSASEAQDKTQGKR